MSVRRRIVTLVAAACLTGFLGPAASAAAAAGAPTVRNGDLAFCEVGTTVTQAPREGAYHPVADGFLAKYSPDGRRIVYTRWGGSDGTGVFVKTLPAGAERQLSNITVSGLAWAPDGKSVAVASGPTLQRVNATTGATSTIYRASSDLRDPAWSPDGTWIAFTTGPAIRLVHPDGTGLRTFTTGGGANNHPDWSPDSQRIAFITDRYVPAGQPPREKAELVTLPRSGQGAPVRVSHLAYPRGIFYIGVAWSPDGRKIAALQFNANHPPNDEDADERFKVRAYLPDGSHSYSLTGPITGDDGPEGLDWAPKLS